MKKVMAVAVVGAMTTGKAAFVETEIPGNVSGKYARIKENSVSGEEKEAKRRRISVELFFKLYGFYNEADGRLF
ncbi:MAG: hypothetical protein ACLVGL_02345 [Waltera sp.]